MPVHELFQSHHPRLYRYFARLSGQPTVAEDLTQEVFLRALKAESGYRAQGQDEAWLFRIARNLWIDRLRRRHRRPTTDATVNDPTPDQLAVPARQELRLRLDEALRQLPEEEREAFLLRETAGLSYAQIASVCRVSLEAVRSRVYRARRALRGALTESAPTTPKLGARPETPVQGSATARGPNPKDAAAFRGPAQTPGQGFPAGLLVVENK